MMLPPAADAATLWRDAMRDAAPRHAGYYDAAGAIMMLLLLVDKDELPLHSPCCRAARLLSLPCYADDRLRH